MKSLQLHRDSRADATALSNTFIDHYMITANGEYVKLYIWLLRCISDQKADLTLSSIADTFDYTEKDVKRALKYWTRAGLLRLDINDAKELTAIHFLDIPVKSEKESRSVRTASVKDDKKTPETKEPARTSAKSSGIQPLSPDRRKALKEKKDIRQILFMAEQYTGKTLSSSDVNSVLYFYDELKFSADLIEYLIGYCVSKGHKSMRYINSVALAWAESSITTVSAAKEHTTLYHENCFAVLKAFGISNRYPAAAEITYINRWTEELGFTMDIVLEACNRTVLAINKPDFKYTNSILENWKRKGVKHLTDIQTLDAKHMEAGTARYHSEKSVNASKRTASADRFNNFEGRDYDYDSLEKELIEAN